MNVHRFVAVGGLCAFAALLALPVWSQDKKEDGKQPEMSAEEKAWMEAGSPGENHKLLEPLVGEWDVETSMFMGPEATKGKAKASSAWMLGGRFVGDEFRGDFMGMPFEGHGVTGYDNIKKKFVSGWIDSMSTNIMTQEGTYDAAKKEFTFTGEFQDPAGAMIKNRMTILIDSPDKHTMTMYHTMKDTPEMKVMELVYTRSKGGDKPSDAGKGH